MNAQTKVISIRVPMSDYVNLINKAFKHQLSMTDLVLAKVFSEDDLEGQIADLNTKLEESNRQMTTLENEVSDLNITLEKSTEQVYKLEANHVEEKTVLENSIAELKDRYANKLNAISENHVEEKATLENVITQLNKGIEEKEILAMLKNSFVAEQEGNYERENKDLKTAISRLENDCNKLTQKYEKLNTSRIEVLNDKRGLKGNITKLQNALTKSTQKIIDLETSLADHLKEKKTLNTKLTKANQQIDAMNVDREKNIQGFNEEIRATKIHNNTKIDELHGYIKRWASYTSNDAQLFENAKYWIELS
jgi:chromosome segregation ATPase